MKRIVILSYGTRGDVQPLMALAQGLQVAGYGVTLGADVEFEGMIKELGVGYAPLKLNLRQFLNTEAGKETMSTERESAEATFDSMVRPMLDDCWAAAQGADLLIYDTMLTPAYHIAQKLEIPAMMTSVMPNMSPTKAFSLIGAPKIGWGGWGNKLSYQLYRLSWFFAYGDVSRWTAATLGLTPKRTQNYWFLRGRRIPILYSYSEHVCPSPADWPAETLASGYWFLDAAAKWTPPADLVAFLAKNPQPIYVGFGSMVGMDTEKLTELVLAAVQKTGQRAVISTGWGGLSRESLPDNVYGLEAAPHEWLFPRVKAVVHHGGAGTTSAGLHFGKPSVLCPFVTDQFFWGEIVHRRGWGPRPIPQKELTVDGLAQAIEAAVMDEGMRAKAEEVGKKIRAEDGVGKAVGFIERYGN